MNNYTLLSHTPFAKNQQIWESLKQAITSSSGFQRWQQEQSINNFSLEEQVRLYLQDTLTTLAY
jgi:hypothetical protein